MKLFYLSFADDTMPKGQQWLGGLYIHAEDLGNAIQRSWNTEQNPGGEVLCGVVPDNVTVDPQYIGRLLTQDELRASAGPGGLVNTKGAKI